MKTFILTLCLFLMTLVGFAQSTASNVQFIEPTITLSSNIDEMTMEQFNVDLQETLIQLSELNCGVAFFQMNYSPAQVIIIPILESGELLENQATLVNGLCPEICDIFVEIIPNNY